jgi:RHS repeat-associated protein
MELRRTIAMKGIWIVFTLLLFALPTQAAVQMYYLHNDHLGTPAVVTNQAQQVVWKGQLKPFGETKVEIETITNHRRFPGQRFDIESRLYYNYFRDYDPSLARYIEADRLDVLGRTNDPHLNAQEIYGEGWFRFNGKWYYDGQVELNHPYGYAAQNPNSFVDSIGLHHKLGHGWNPPKAEHPLGYYLTKPNGNLWDGFNRQDWKCSVPGVGCLMDKNTELLDRCINHDQCYKDNECNASSWIGNALGSDKSCNECNGNF